MELKACAPTAQLSFLVVLVLDAWGKSKKKVKTYAEFPAFGFLEC